MKKSLLLAALLIPCLLSGFTAPAVAFSDVEKAEKKVEKAQEAVEKAKKAVDDEIARLKKEAEQNPKAHGTAPELEKLRKALKKAEAELEKARKALKKAAEDAVKKAQKQVDREKARRPPDPQKLDEAEKALKDAKEKLKAIGDGEAAPAGTEAPGTQGAYYFLAGLTGGTTIGEPAAIDIDLPGLQAMLFDPEAAGQLFEALGGEFFPGDPMGSKTGASFPMTGHIQFTPGLRLGAGFGDRLELRSNIRYFSGNWSGNFPVTVFPFQDRLPYLLEGTMEASVSGIMTDVDLTFFLTRGTVRPYIEAGARGIFPTTSGSAARLAGVDLPLDIESPQTQFSPFGGAGIRICCWKNGFADAGVSYGKTAGGNYTPMLELGAGWQFGK